jgi:hypothetical protein
LRSRIGEGFHIRNGGNPMLGVSATGNATLIAYDDKPILATDPWFGDENPAYFGS